MGLLEGLIVKLRKKVTERLSILSKLPITNDKIIQNHRIQVIFNDNCSVT
jgi:hypothetical protein